MKRCWYCEKTKPFSQFNLNGRGSRRARCKPCENIGRLAAKKRKLKSSKNIITTHGGSSESRQKVVRHV